MPDDIVIEAYERKDRDECIRLLAATFPDTSNEATFVWRFESGGRPDPIIICAKHRGKVISFNSWIPWEFTYRGKGYLGYQSGESATHVEYRGKGIFKRVVNHADQVAMQRGVDFFFGFPNPASYGSFITCGYRAVATNRYSVRVLHPFKKGRAYDIEKADRCLAQVMLVQEDRITPAVNQAYDKWRYDINTKDYDTIEYAEDGSLAVFILQKRIRKGIPEALLLDCQLTNYNEIFVDNAFEHLDAVYTRRACYIRTFFNENTDRGRTLKKYFSLRVKNKYQILIVKNISSRLDSNILFNAYNWDLMPHCVDWL